MRPANRRRQPVLPITSIMKREIRGRIRTRSQSHFDDLGFLQQGGERSISYQSDIDSQLGEQSFTFAMDHRGRRQWMSRDKPLVLSDYGLREEFEMSPEDSQEGSVFPNRDLHQGFGFRDGDSGSEFETLPDDQNQDSVISDGGPQLLIKETPTEDSKLLMQIPDEKERNSCSQELSRHKSSEEKQDGRDANKFQPSTEVIDFRLVFSMGLKIIEYDDATTRRLYKYLDGRLCIIAQNKIEPKWNMSEEECVFFVKDKDFPYIRRPDELQKRGFSILTWCLQHQYKRSFNLLTSEVHEMMRKVYGLDEKPREYSHIFEKRRAQGMHSIACYTILAKIYGQ